jgi:hypothetical protein
MFTILRIHDSLSFCYDMLMSTLHFTICFTICLFISPDLDGQRAPNFSMMFLGDQKILESNKAGNPGVFSKQEVINTTGWRRGRPPAARRGLEARGP